MVYDAIIIGGGPAGLAAAVYFARQKLRFLLLADLVGGYVLYSQDVENYLGFHLLNGEALVASFKKHLADYRDAVEIHEGEPVERVENIDGVFRVVTMQGTYEAQSLLVATGSKHRELGIPGEREFTGKGVTYCATCDAPLFRDKRVIVVGGGNSAMDAALFARKYTDDVVIVSVNPELKGDAVMKAKILADTKIQIRTSTKTTRIVGETMVTGVAIVGPDGVEHTEPAQGVFVEIGLEPASDFISIVAKDRWNQIVVDKYNRTSVPGIYAAGDVTDVTAKQIAVAVGEGSKAALGVISWLQTKKA